MHNDVTEIALEILISKFCYGLPIHECDATQAIEVAKVLVNEKNYQGIL